MSKLSKKESIVKEKSEFIKNNAIELYTLLTNSSRNSYDFLTSILLSDKPLEECSKYNDLKTSIIELDRNIINKVDNENYPLKVIFCIARYVNTIGKPDETQVLREKIRRYTKYMDNHIIDKKEIKLGEIESSKVLKKV